MLLLRLLRLGRRLVRLGELFVPWKMSYLLQELMLTWRRLLKDVETIESRLSKLDGGQDLGGKLVDAVKSKKMKAGTEANGGAMFDADAEAEGEDEIDDEKDGGGARKSKDGAEKQTDANTGSKKQEDKGGGGGSRSSTSHQRTSTVEILGKGNK